VPNRTVRTTFRPTVEIEVSAQEFRDLTRQGLLATAEQIAAAENAAKPAAPKPKPAAAPPPAPKTPATTPAAGSTTPAEKG
jgi:hypothetical protein